MVAWPEPSDLDEQDKHHGAAPGKTRALTDAAAGHPFAWVDDEITATDQACVSAHHRGRRPTQIATSRAPRRAAFGDIYIALSSEHSAV
jgi:hypothetical protein